MGAAPKRLLLMRHAKSDWSDGSISDHDRTLNARGQDAAPRMALWLASEGLVPEVILCSTSVRTSQTLALMLNVWRNNAVVADSEPEVHYIRELYLAPASVLVSHASQFVTRESVLVLAHNPGMEDAVSFLSGSHSEMPTAAIAVFDVAGQNWPSEWFDVAAWKLRNLVKPRELGR
jgi:phosphohistidine phosphatase